jgi:hypothetical protein
VLWLVRAGVTEAEVEAISSVSEEEWSVWEESVMNLRNLWGCQLRSAGVGCKGQVSVPLMAWVSSRLATGSVSHRLGCELQLSDSSSERRESFKFVHIGNNEYETVDTNNRRWNQFSSACYRCQDFFLLRSLSSTPRFKKTSLFKDI